MNCELLDEVSTYYLFWKSGTFCVLDIIFLPPVFYSEMLYVILLIAKIKNKNCPSVAIMSYFPFFSDTSALKATENFFQAFLKQTLCQNVSP